MPLHGSYLQRDCYLFLNNLEKNLEFKYNKNDIIDIEKTKEKIEKNLSLIKVKGILSVTRKCVDIERNAVSESTLLD